jgi:hypothetical protein
VNATITNNGGEVSGAGGGVTSFTQTATAADARITCNGGFGGGDGGESWGQSLLSTVQSAADAEFLAAFDAFSSVISKV